MGRWSLVLVVLWDGKSKGRQEVRSCQWTLAVERDTEHGWTRSSLFVRADPTFLWRGRFVMITSMKSCGVSLAP